MEILARCQFCLLTLDTTCDLHLVLRPLCSFVQLRTYGLSSDSLFIITASLELHVVLQL